MNDITQGMKFTIDVKSGLVEMPQRAVLMKGDKNANRVSMALVDGEKAVSLEGATVTGTYVLAGIKMPLLGDVNENEATIILPDECYLSSGRYELRMHVALGSVKRTFLFITGYVESDGEGGTLDVEGVIPNIDDIIAQYAQMKEVTERTQEAADKANDAASRAPYVGANGNWYVWNAASGSYIDSGSKAQGPVGPQGPGAEIDDTLSQSGKAADAKKTGEALSQLSQQKVDKANVVNNFTTTEDGFVADARALKEIMDMLTPQALSYTESTYTQEHSVVIYKIGRMLVVSGWIMLNNYSQNGTVFKINGVHLPKSQSIGMFAQGGATYQLTFGTGGNASINAVPSNNYYNFSGVIIVD